MNKLFRTYIQDVWKAKNNTYFFKISSLIYFFFRIILSMSTILLFCYKLPPHSFRNACLKSVRSCWRKLRRSKKSCRRRNLNSMWWRRKRSGGSPGRDDSFSAMAPIEQPGTKYNSMSQSSHFKYFLIRGDQEVGRWAQEIFVDLINCIC